MIARACLALILLAAPAAAQEREVAPGIHLITGSFEPGRQPDGNSVLIEGPDGLLLIDTGRHAAHLAKVEAVIAARAKPLRRIINTHWHLDHVSGNLALKAKHPDVRVSASNAIDGALDGFLKRSAEGARAALDAGKIPEPMASDVRGDLATFARGKDLRPDNVISSAVADKSTGRRIDISLAPHAATEGDVWLYDPQSRVLIAGDLVTQPVPFLDTACPDGWRKALDAIAATPFETLIPGHGAPMDRAAFSAWKTSFDAFVDCARGTQKVTYCAAGWYDRATSHSTFATEKVRILGMADYYANRIRSGDLDKNCPA